MERQRHERGGHSIIGRGIVEQQWRQRQAGPGAFRVRAESVNDQDTQGLPTTRKRRVGIGRHWKGDQLTPP